MTAILGMLATERLVRLSAVDLAIVIFYFALVLGIGFYLKRFAKTGEDFFLAGREMTAWVAGLAFVSANLGSLELLGWAGSAYQYGILAAHWYWIGAIPAMPVSVIIRDLEILSGEPVFRGTRVPFQSLTDYLAHEKALVSCWTIFRASLDLAR